MRDIKSDLPDGLDERRVELEQQKIWYAQTRAMRQKEAYKVGDAARGDFDILQGTHSHATPEMVAKSQAAAEKLFETSSFFLTEVLLILI